MSDKRLEVASEYFKRELAQIINREIEFPAGVIFTLTKVVLATGFSQAKVFVSIYPPSRAQQIFTKLIKQAVWLRREMGRQDAMWRTPKILFQLDTSGDRAMELNQLLDSLSKHR